MWTNGFNTFGNAIQPDMQPNNWLNQNISSGLNSKSLVTLLSRNIEKKNHKNLVI